MVTFAAHNCKIAIMATRKTIHRVLLAACLWLVAGSSIFAHKGVQAEGDALYERLLDYGLRGMTDSVYARKDAALQFFADNHQWEHYYYVANLAIQLRVMRDDQPMEGLRQCRELYKFATDHRHDYGQASVLARLGWLYGYIGDHQEAVAQLRESIPMFRHHKTNLDILDIYYTYAYMLELTGNYDEEARVIDEGMERYRQMEWRDTTSLAYRTVQGNLLNAKALMEVRRGNLDRAAELIGVIRQRVGKGFELTSYESLRTIAEYHVARKEYSEALAVTDSMLQMTEELNSGLRWGLTLLRSEIIRNLGRGDEAYDMLRQLMATRDNAETSKMRRQLSEFDSFYQIKRMELREEKAHFWYAVSIGLVCIMALMVFAFFRQRTARLLARKNQELEQALDHAQEADRMKTAFVQHISHEIRTPLNIITGFAQIISNPEYELSEEDRNRMLADIGHNTNEITNFVNELLELSESESQSHYDKNDDVDVVALCQQVLDRAEGEAAGRVRLVLDNRLAEHFMLRSNDVALQKILDRLMSNALKFTAEGCITIRIDTGQNTQLRIEVEDTGIGIPAEQSEKIFERFYKVNSFKQGIGLGLTVARRTAELLGGTLTLDTSYASGARFVLKLPTLNITRAPARHFCL